MAIARAPFEHDINKGGPVTELWYKFFVKIANGVYNALTITGLFKTEAGRIKNIRVESTSTTLLATDHVLRMNVDAGDVNVQLPPLVEGTEYWLENSSIDTGNKINWIPDGTDLLFGVNETFPVYDEEDWIIIGEPVYGWR